MASLLSADGSTRGSFSKSLTTSTCPFSEAQRMTSLLLSDYQQMDQLEDHSAKA
jgi:hypothetical protein